MTRAKPVRLVLATHNAHKVEEMQELLAESLGDQAPTLLSLADYPDLAEPVEDGVTFVDNAKLKAAAAAAATGLAALADDSGLEVEVLGGAPGVFSARWSGSRAGAGASRAERDRANLDLLLEQVADVPDAHRAAAFVCCLVLAMPDGAHYAAEGRCEGMLARSASGTGGFGYDPIFVPAEQAAGEHRSLAEHSAAEKHAISHRGKAVRLIVPALRELGLITGER